MNAAERRTSKRLWALANPGKVARSNKQYRQRYPWRYNASAAARMRRYRARHSAT